MAKLAIVLATYNEAGNLPRLIEILEELSLPLDVGIYVVDDNSPDGTGDAARRLNSRYGNISVLTRPRRLGLGSALRDGMKRALVEDFSYILTMDADLSHSPRDVPSLVATAFTEDADLVQASRYVQGGGTTHLGWRRRLQSRIANFLFRWLLGGPHEATTNFRVYSRRCAGLVVSESRGRDFEFQPECILIAMSHGLRIVEVPITFTGRTEGKSKLGPVQILKWLLFVSTILIPFKLRMGRFSRIEPIST